MRRLGGVHGHLEASQCLTSGGDGLRRSLPSQIVSVHRGLRFIGKIVRIDATKKSKQWAKIALKGFIKLLQDGWIASL